VTREELAQLAGWLARPEPVSDGQPVFVGASARTAQRKRLNDNGGPVST
jgi:hypothetical protein